MQEDSEFVFEKSSNGLSSEVIWRWFRIFLGILEAESLSEYIFCFIISTFYVPTPLNAITFFRILQASIIHAMTPSANIT